MAQYDVVIVGSGHNALVCALLLARAKRRVHVVERSDTLGGATRTERPFAKAPEVRSSTGAYLLGLMPPELLQRLDLELPLIRRDPHYFLPSTGSDYLLFGSDAEALQSQMVATFGRQDWEAHQRLHAELDALREDIGPTWLESPLSIEQTAERYVRPALRDVFIELCRGSVGRYLNRFGFESDRLKAMYAVTDGFSGLSGGWDTPGTGMNFLVHNMCRLPGSDGTWMVVRGGMGTVARMLEDAARRAGVTFETNAEVAAVDVQGGSARGVTLSDGRSIAAEVVVLGTDPFRFVQWAPFGDDFRARVDAWRRDGMTMKVNLCLSELPKFRCLPEAQGQHHGTIHLLPDEDDVLGAIATAYADASAGRLPDFPTIEWYIHTTLDDSLSDSASRHSSALFVQWVPHTIDGSSWEAEESRYVTHLLSLCDRFAPGTSDRVVDTYPLTPPKLEAKFGLSRGHIHHVDNSFGFSDRVPYRLPIDGLYACGAGCHPAGSVIGAAGHNAAQQVLRDGGDENRALR